VAQGPTPGHAFCALLDGNSKQPPQPPQKQQQKQRQQQLPLVDQAQDNLPQQKQQVLQQKLQQ